MANGDNSGIQYEVIAPDGTKGIVSAANLSQVGGGYKLSGRVRMYAPDGTPGFVSTANIAEAGRNGYTVAPPTQFEQQRGGPQPGIVSSGASELGQQAIGLLKSLYPNKSNMYGLAGPGGILAPAQGALNAIQSWQQRTQQGRSVPYKLLTGGAQLANLPTGAEGEEQAAETGNWRGVLGHALVPALEAMAAPAIHEAGVRIMRTAPLPEGTSQAPAPETPSGAPASEAPGGKNFSSMLGITDPPPAALLTKAIKPLASNTGWDKAITRAAPDMKAVEPLLDGPITGVDSSLDAVSLAKKGIWSIYADKLKAASAIQPGGEASETVGQTPAIDGNQIANAMLDSINARARLQNPALVQRVTDIANTYRRPMSVMEAEDFLQSANADLHSYYAKNKVGRQVAQNDPEVSSTVAEADQLRDSLYAKLDELTGPGARDLKARYGALTNVEQELLRRKNVAARQQPQSLAEQLSMARAAGKIAMGTARLDPFQVLEGTQSLAAAKWLKERGTTDAMITRAFQAMNPPPPAQPVQAAPVTLGPIGAAQQPQQSGYGNLANLLGGNP